MLFEFHWKLHRDARAGDTSRQILLSLTALSPSGPWFFWRTLFFPGSEQTMIIFASLETLHAETVACCYLHAFWAFLLWKSKVPIFTWSQFTKCTAPPLPGVTSTWISFMLRLGWGWGGEVVIDHLSSKSDNFPQKCALIGGGGGTAFWEHLAVETNPKTFILCGMQDAAAAGLLYWSQIHAVTVWSRSFIHQNSPQLITRR